MNMYLEELNDAYKVLYYGYTDMATPEDQRKGIHDIQRFKCYPPYPWKMDGVDHINDDPRLFFNACINAGLVMFVRKEDVDNRYEETITYEQWLTKHQSEPGFVNHMTNGFKPKDY